MMDDEQERKIETSLASVVKAMPTLEEIAQYDKVQLREFIATVETAMHAAPTDRKVDPPLNHHFSKDVYAREMFIPAGCLVVGKIHKHENLNIMSKGDITVISIDGVKRIKAPATFVSSPGVKRIGFAHEDTIWTTIHGTPERDLEKIEEQFIAKDYSEVIEGDKCLGQQQP